MKGAKPGQTFPSVDSPLDEVNRSFHTAFDEARGAERLRGPVVVVLADSLVLFRPGKRRDFPVTPRLFHVIKSIAHGPIALYASLQRFGDARLDAVLIQRLRRLRATTAAATSALANDVPDAAVRADLKPLLDGCVTLLDQLLAAGSLSTAALAAFAQRMGPVLLRSTEHATRIQLAALHAAAEAATADLDGEERTTLQIVVTGDHQARARSLGMQYFQKRLGEPPGVEERVTYGEGVADAEEALALVGTLRADRAIASAFFGDAHKLQRDVLGDAVHALLEHEELPPLG